MEKVVLVTGASKGIGKAAALHLDKLGFHVLAGVRKAADGDTLRAAASPRLTPLIIDVTRPETIQAAVESARPLLEKHGLAGLVNNAGVVVPAPLEYIPMDDFRYQMEVNVTGQVAVTQAFLPFLRQAKGRIVNISSIGGLIVAIPANGPYHISKYALEAVTDALRLELRPWGIEVIAIQPGTITTPIWDTTMATADAVEGRMSPRVGEHYSDIIRNARAYAAQSSTNGLPPEAVAEVIAQALTTPRPRARYLVGGDAKFVARIIRRLPTRLRERMILMDFNNKAGAWLKKSAAQPNAEKVTAR